MSDVPRIIHTNKKTAFNNTRKRSQYVLLTKMQSLGCVILKANSFLRLFVHAQLGLPGEGGLRGHDSGRTRYSHQEPSHQVRRPRLLSHPEEHRAEDADEGHLAAPGG